MLCRYCIFYKLKVCGNPALSKSISTIFQIVFAHFMSWCPLLAKTNTLTHTIQDIPIEEEVHCSSSGRKLTGFRDKVSIVRLSNSLIFSSAVFNVLLIPSSIFLLCCLCFWCQTATVFLVSASLYVLNSFFSFHSRASPT